jgi:hypothetical protein
MEGRISRLDHHGRRFSAPPGSSQTNEARWSTHSTSEGFPRRIPVETGSGASAPRGRAPLRSAMKRSGESRNSLASGSSTSNGRASESIYFEPSSSRRTFPNQINTGNSERPSRNDARIEFPSPDLQQHTGTSTPVDLPIPALNELPLRRPISIPLHKQNLVSVLISRLRTGRQRADSAPTPPTPHVVAPRSLLSQYPHCDTPEDTPTLHIRNCTPSDSDSDILPSPNLSPELPIRKTVRFAIWSHMRTFERHEWEPTGDTYEGTTGYRSVLRKVGIFGHLYGIRGSLMLPNPAEALI